MHSLDTEGVKAPLILTLYPFSLGWEIKFLMNQNMISFHALSHREY